MKLFRKDTACLLLSGLFVAVFSCAVFGQDGEVVISQGTIVRVRLERTVSTAYDYTGANVPVTVVRDVFAGRTLVIAAGAATSSSLWCQKPGNMGKEGMISVRTESIQAVDSSFVPVKSGNCSSIGQGQDSFMLGCMFGIWSLFIKGGDAVIPKGKEFDCTVANDVSVRIRSAP
jgi:hypothetical protein